MKVVLWLLCAVVLTAFLDNRPDPPATKPNLAAGMSTGHLPTDFSHPHWTWDSLERVQVPTPDWAECEEAFTVERHVFQRIPAGRTSGLSPPPAA